MGNGTRERPGAAPCRKCSEAEPYFGEGPCKGIVSRKENFVNSGVGFCFPNLREKQKNNRRECGDYAEFGKRPWDTFKSEVGGNRREKIERAVTLVML